MKIKPEIAVVRGRFLNAYEMQIFAPLTAEFALTAFGSLKPYQDQFNFPVVKLPSPMDLPNIPAKMPLLNRLLIDAHYLFGLERALRGFDLVHSAETYFHYTQQSLRAKRRGFVRRVVATVLENIPFNNESIWGRKNFKARARLELDQLIALTQLSRRALLQEGADPAKITVIGHGIDTRKFHPGNTQKVNNTFRLLFVGRVEEYKGVFDLLAAFLKLKNDRKLRQYNLKLTFVGEGSEKKKLLKQVSSIGLNNCVFFKSNNYQQMPVVYHQAEIFTAPSKAQLDRFGRTTWLEQYNTALLEAQASGLPIIATNSGGIPENLGTAGLLVPPDDAVTLVRAIKQYLLNPSLRQLKSKQARDRALAVHDARIIAGRLKALYQKLLSK